MTIEDLIKEQIEQLDIKELVQNEPNLTPQEKQKLVDLVQKVRTELGL